MLGVNADGSIDETNINGFAYKNKKRQEESEENKRNLQKYFQNTRLSQTTGQLRSALLKRGVDVSQIAPEKLIALSDEIGEKAFTDIYNAKAAMENSIEEDKRLLEESLQGLRTKGLITNNEYLVNKQKAKELFDAQIAAINKNFANALFGLQDSRIEEDKVNKQEVINTVASMATQFNLPNASLGVMRNIINSSSDGSTAYQTILDQLNDKTSALYIAVNDADLAAKAAAAFESETERLIAQAKLNSANSSGSS